MRYQDVFVPGGFPKHTYNPREVRDLERRLSECKDNLCKLVTVTGQTKSGKTVLARKVLPRDEAVWIDGGVPGDEEEFWQVVVEALQLFQQTEDTGESETSGKIASAVEGEGNAWLLKGRAGITTEVNHSQGSGTGATRSLSSRITALTALAEQKIPLVIDDFHYLPKEMQGGVIRALKPLIFDGLPVSIIAIPHRRYDAMKVEKEMTGRVVPIEIPPWSDEELRFIPTQGFDLLNYDTTEQDVDYLCNQAIGSPHLMQDFCRGICKLSEVSKTLERRQIRIAQQKLDEMFKDVAETIGRPIFEKLARGPRQRSDRLVRELTDGRKVDIYELVLHALASIRPGLISLEYEDLRAAIKSVSASQIPQLHEVVRVLKHMATIAASDQSSTPVIDFDEEEQKLHITDPFFAFYLRWGDLPGSRD